MRILGVSGSLDAASSNAALLRSMAQAMSPPISMDVFGAIDALPYFSTDRDREPLVQSVRRWRGAVGVADAVVVATPEYAGGMPGALKNALDWLVGSGELYGKPAVIVSAAPSEDRGRLARDGVELTLSMQGALVCDSFTVAIGRGHAAGELAAAADVVASRVVAVLTSGPCATAATAKRAR
jgi:chromate reductase, NAD(P)H dehydrogenase (quinone)